jgi:NAD(P)H-flavin reductase
MDPYRPIRATVENVTAESPTIKTVVVRPDTAIPFKTGQFVELSVPGEGEAPFTPSSSPEIDEKMDVTIMEAGRVTRVIHNLKPGATIGVRGPYGKGYPLDEFAGKDILIVGGGVGLAPLRSLLYALLADPERFPRIVLCYGARTPADVIYKQEVEGWRGNKQMEVHQSVDKADDGWPHTEGVVTVLLDDVEIDPATSVGVVCGPPVMMKFGTFKLLELGYAEENIYLSMEKNMSCGIGKCGHCRLGPFYVCKDGPVFTYAQLKGIEKIWD